MHDTHPGTRVCIIFYEIRLKRQDGCDLLAVGFGLQSCVYHLLRHGSLRTLRTHHLSDHLFARHFRTSSKARRARHGGCCDAQSGITQHLRQSTLQTKFGFVTTKFEVAQFLILPSHEMSLPN